MGTFFFLFIAFFQLVLLHKKFDYPNLTNNLDLMNKVASSIRFAKSGSTVLYLREI